MTLLLAFIIAMAVAMALIPLFMRWARAMRVVDFPNERRVHSVPIPRVGGMAMVAGTLLSLLVWLPRDDVRLLAYMAGAAIIFAFGVWDDREDLPPLAKVAGQLLAILVVVLFGGITIDSFTLTERHPLPPWVGVPLTVLFILGVTNAINLSDGLDGLAGGTTLLSAFALGLLARASGDLPVAIIALALSGAILGFLRFNTYPARVFMGDGGSQFLGFTVAVLSVLVTQQESVPLSTALPIMLLGLPVIDTFMVMSQRLREGQPLFSADKRHIHHKLLALGFDHYESVLFIYLVHAVFFLLAWLMRYEPDPYILLAFLSLAGVIVGTLIAAGRFHWRWRKPSLRPAGHSLIGRAVIWMGETARLPHWAMGVAIGCVLAYFATVAISAEPSRDVGFLAIAIIVLIAGALWLPFKQGREPWVTRAVLCTTVAVAVYLDHKSAFDPQYVRMVKYAAFPLLGFCVLLRMRFSERRFEITTLDLLLIFIAIVIPNLPGLGTSTASIAFLVMKLVVLLYTVELCVDQGDRSRRAISVGALCFGVAVLARAFL